MRLPPSIGQLAALFIGSLALLVLTFFASPGRGTLAFQIFLLLLSASSATGLLLASYRQDASKVEPPTRPGFDWDEIPAPILPEPFLMETLMDNLPDHIYFKDRQSRFIRINKAMARRFNLAAPAEAIGKTDFDFFTAEHAQQAFDDEREIIRTGKPMVDREEKETWPDGSVSWVSTTKQLLRDKNGGIIGTFVLSRDITPRKAAEEALAKKAEELARSNRELEQFAYVASHDLQEPLRMIASYTQLLARRYQGQLDKDANEFIAYAVEGATRMQVLINDLLAYSRVGTRGKPFSATDCNEVLARALDNLKFAIQEAHATVSAATLPVV